LYFLYAANRAPIQRFCWNAVTAIGCTGVFNNRTYDLKSLISPSGSYVWKQDIYQTSGSLLYAPADYDKISVTFELQVCCLLLWAFVVFCCADI
jgi:hypothetical protein